MRKLFREIEKGRLRPTPPVLIMGESGTGKRASSHNPSIVEARVLPRPSSPVNSSALPEALAESELFGHEKRRLHGGGFVAGGEVRARPSRHALSRRSGDVEPRGPGEAPPRAREPEIRAASGEAGPSPSTSVSSRRPTRISRRGVAAGPSGKDLFYRLNTVVLRIPPLRDRSGRHTAAGRLLPGEMGKASRADSRRFSPGALDALIRHGWPGNVRELEHLVEMLTLMVEGE